MKEPKENIEPVKTTERTVTVFSKITISQKKAFGITIFILAMVLIAMLKYTIDDRSQQTTVQIILPKPKPKEAPSKPKLTPKGKLQKVALKAQAKNTAQTASKKKSVKKTFPKKSRYKKFKSSSNSNFRRRLAALKQQDNIEMVDLDTTKIAYESKQVERISFQSKESNKGLEKATHSGSAKQENTKDNNSYNAIQFHLENRSLAIDLPNPIYTCDVSGKVVILIRVNRKGKVIEAIVDTKNTKTNSPCILRNGVKYAKRALFSPSDMPIQTGTITYHFTS